MDKADVELPASWAQVCVCGGGRPSEVGERLAALVLDERSVEHAHLLTLPTKVRVRVRVSVRVSVRVRVRVSGINHIRQHHLPDGGGRNVCR